jgi:hypothetical protein
MHDEYRIVPHGGRVRNPPARLYVDAGHIGFVPPRAIGKRNRPDTVGAEPFQRVRRDFGEVDDLHGDSSSFADVGFSFFS